MHSTVWIERFIDLLANTRIDLCFDMDVHLCADIDIDMCKGMFE